MMFNRILANELGRQDEVNEKDLDKALTDFIESFENWFTTDSIDNLLKTQQQLSIYRLKKAIDRLANDKSRLISNHAACIDETLIRLFK